MNVGEIKTRVKRAFGDESGVQIDDTDLIRYINDAQMEIAKENEGLFEASAVSASVAGQAEYSLPVDTLIFRSLSYKAPGEVAYTQLKGYSINEFNEYIGSWDGNTSRNGTPICYMIFANKITLFFPPDHNLAAAMKIYYNRKPILVASDVDIPELPEVYHPTIVRMCLAYAYEMDEDWDAVGAKGQQIAGDLRVLRGRDDWKEEATYPTITVLAEDQW